MDPQQPPPPPPPPPPVYIQSSGVFGTKIPSTVSFAIGLLLFLLPFAQIKCKGQVFAENSGLGIAVGSEWKVMGGGMFGDERRGENKAPTEADKKNGPNAFAIAAMALGLLGLLLSFGNAKTGGTGGVITGLLSSVSLIGLMIDLKNNTKLTSPDMEPYPKDKGFFGDSLDNVRVTLDFTPWFYIAVIAFLAAAFFCYRRLKAGKL